MDDQLPQQTYNRYLYMCYTCRQHCNWLLLADRRVSVMPFPHMASRCIYICIYIYGYIQTHIVWTACTYLHSMCKSTCASPNLHNTISGVRLQRAPSLCPRTHARCTRQDMNICVRLLCAAQVELHSVSSSRRKLKMKSRRINRAWL